MEHKKRFVLVTLVLLAAILGTVGMSVAWMLETRHSLEGEFDGRVQAALEDAVALERKIIGARELDIRIPSAQEHGTWGVLNSLSPDIISSITVYKREEGDIDHMSVFLNADSLEGAKVNVPLLRSLLAEALHTRGIQGKWALWVLRRAPTPRRVVMDVGGSIRGMSIRVAGAEGDTTLLTYGGDSLAVSPLSASVTDTLCADPLPTGQVIRRFQVEGENGGQAEYHLYVEVPGRLMWGKLGGVVVAAVVIALVLCSSFVYLLRTVLRMKTLGQMRQDFTHNITHELKTPIAAAYATNEALADFAVAEDPVRRQKYLDIQRHYLQSLSAMVERILSLSVQEQERFRLHPEPCLLSEVVDEEVRMLPLRSPGNLNVDTQWPDGRDLRVMADRFHLANVLRNLLDNAVKYAGPHPHIGIRTGYTSDGHLYLSVSDDGPGIPHSQRRRIFEKYYRIPTGDRHNVRGYGIGLYYCRLVVEKMGGSIRVTDRPGGGSEFIITL